MIVQRLAAAVLVGAGSQAVLRYQQKNGSHQDVTSRGYRAESEANTVPTDETIFHI
jgi:hypothetical protein